MAVAVFINYRGEDSHSYGALLYHELARQFGDDYVFFDAASIPAGADFVQELLGRVRSARVLLAVIGRRWLTAANDTGQRRIDDPTDWIRRELAEAFSANVRVIPVLTDQAELPPEATLPADIAALSRCPARPLRRRESTADLARIVTDLTNVDSTLAAVARNRENTPRQLPAPPRHFIGRADELAQLTAESDSSTPLGGTVGISALAGAGGIGKTALALHWAHQNLHRFPDGQLFVDLQGFSPAEAPMPPAVAVRGFLDALGVPAHRIPPELQAQAARYRSLVTGKRMLIVLDNAADATQVMPLLPGSPTCTVLVTSRRHLTSLITRHSAHHLRLDTLTDAEAHELLATRLGTQRMGAEPDAVAQLLACCGGFPLALAIVAGRIHTTPDQSLATLGADLRDETTRLGVLDDDDPAASLPAALSWSLHALSDEQIRVFGLVGIAPGPDTTLPAVASLVGLASAQTEQALRGLQQASLLDHSTTGRYAMHDLIRSYARDTAHQRVPVETRQAALLRVVDFYLHTAHTAERLINPHRPAIHLDPPTPGCHPEPLPNGQSAWDWFDAEHPCLLAALHTATTHRWHQTAWNLVWTLGTFHNRRGHRHDRLAVWQAALDAVDHLPDPAAHTLTHQRLGTAYADLGQHEQAIEHLQHALALAERNDDSAGQAHAHHALAWAWELRDDDQQALHHVTHARNLFHALHQPVWEARVLNTMGWYAARLGDFDTARDHCEAALTLFRRHDDPDGEAATLDSMAYIDHHTGHHDRAISHYQQALTQFRSDGDNSNTPGVLDRLGHSHAALGQQEQARAVWQEASELYRRQGHDDKAAGIQQQLDDLDKTDKAP